MEQPDMLTNYGYDSQLCGDSTDPRLGRTPTCCSDHDSNLLGPILKYKISQFPRVIL